MFDPVLNLPADQYEALLGLTLAVAVAAVLKLRSKYYQCEGLKGDVHGLTAEIREQEVELSNTEDKLAKTTKALKASITAGTKAILTITAKSMQLLDQERRRAKGIEKAAYETIADLDDQIDELNAKLATAGKPVPNSGRDPIRNILGVGPGKIDTYAFNVGKDGRLDPVDIESAFFLDNIGGPEALMTSTIPHSGRKPLTPESLLKALRDLPPLPRGPRSGPFFPDFRFRDLAGDFKVADRVLGDAEAAADFATDPVKGECAMSQAARQRVLNELAEDEAPVKQPAGPVATPAQRAAYDAIAEASAAAEVPLAGEEPTKVEDTERRVPRFAKALTEPYGGIGNHGTRDMPGLGLNTNPRAG